MRFITEGGWGIMPVLLCGSVSVILALAFAVSLRRQILPLLAGFWITTLLSGVLGCVAGVQSTLRVAVDQGLDGREVLTGVRESLNVAYGGIFFALLAALVSCAGGFRVAWRSGARG